MEAGVDLVLNDLPQLLLEASILLSIAVPASMVTRRAHIPLTVVLAAGGLLVTEVLHRSRHRAADSSGGSSW